MKVIELSIILFSYLIIIFKRAFLVPVKMIELIARQLII